MGFTTLANAGQTGTLWGSAYSKQAKRLFVSAFVRRHAGLGPLGAGGIYVLNPSTPNLSANLGFVSLDALGFPTHSATGAYNIKSNAARELPAVPFNVPTHDVDAYDQVGKTALGDLELSEDGRYLFTVNLYDRKLYRLDLRDPASPVVPTAAQVTSYAIPNACTGAKEGEYRPFGLKVQRGKLYVGSVCSGENAALAGVGTSADMKLNVHEYDVSNLAATPSLVYSQTLAYRDTDTLKSGNITAKWSAWSTQFNTSDYNAPMLTDIDFDNKGNLLLGLADRNSYQVGSANYSTNTADTAGYSKYYANGDLLKLNKDVNCKFTPAIGNFYQNDFYDDNARWTNAYGCGETCHHEQTLGAIATHRFGDKDEVVTTAFNPVFYTSNGYIAFNNANGTQARANEVWYDPNFDQKVTSNFGKAGGLGDIEVLSEPAPIEIGNRVWFDADSDGIQDAGEPGIDDVVVSLKCGADPVLKLSTTNGGQYLFSSATTAPTMGAGESCTLSVDGSQVPLKSYSLTAKNADSLTDNNANTDIRDSDATDNAGTAAIAFTVGNAGENNHSLDFGYKPPLLKTALKLTKNASKSMAKSGDTMIYTLTLTNESAVDATGIEVNDTLPSGLTYISNTASQGSYTGGIWNIGSVKAGNSATLEITVKIK
jgi:uncharacterized repeat protein (TIGR01451 family)